MTSKLLRGGVSALSAAAALLLATTAASATEGYFQTGYGTIQKAHSGAGVANPEDAMTLSVNPAGLTSVGRQFEAAFTLFSPLRDHTATASALAPPAAFPLAPGKVESTSNLFLMPNMAYSSPIDSQSAWGVALFGNGGMNTNYHANVFGGGNAGVNLEQMFLTVGYARKMGEVSVGVAPVFAIQKFRADGLMAFDSPAFSANPGHVTDRGDDYAVGGGLRVGIQWALQPGLRLGLSGQTPIWSTKFNKYSGLFAGGGSFDVPGSITAGLAWDALPTLTLMADWRHIFYSAVPAIANSSVPAAPFGASNGPGFGWRDVDAISVAAAWKATSDLTLRLGYSHNTNPVRAGDVLLNVLAPGVVTDHLSAGLSYAWTKNLSIDLAGGYVPRHAITGVNNMAPDQNIRLSMEQFEGSFGLRYRY